MLTQKELKNRLIYDDKTGLFSNKKGKIIGSISLGYIRISINKKSYQAHRLAWLYVYGKLPKCQIDHINHNRADNKINNLREVTNLENGKNQSLRNDSKSGVVGVSWHTASKKWRARIMVDGADIHLGHFFLFHEAVNARKNAEVLYDFHENHGKDK